MKVAYVTGASRGLGKRIAEMLSAEYEIADGAGDVRERKTFDFERLDLFVANAGVSVDKPLIAMSEKEWDDVIAVNLSGVFYGVRGCASLLEKTGGAAIIISSILGQRGSWGSAAYAASKAALFGLARSAARELAPDVRVNVVIPGYLDTDMGRATPDALERARAEHPCGVLTSIDDVARLVCDVAKLTTVTGQIFTADGRMASWS